MIECALSGKLVNIDAVEPVEAAADEFEAPRGWTRIVVQRRVANSEREKLEVAIKALVDMQLKQSPAADGTPEEQEAARVEIDYMMRLQFAFSISSTPEDELEDQEFYVDTTTPNVAEEIAKLLKILG